MNKCITLFIGVLLIFSVNTEAKTIENGLTSNSTISVYNDTCYAIKNDNTLWGWGKNHNGSLGENSPNICEMPIKLMDDVKSVNENYIIKNDSTLWTLGSNVFSESTAPTQVMTNVKSVSAASGYVLVLKNDNSLWKIDMGVDGVGYMEPDISYTGFKSLDPVKIMNNVKKAAAGRAHSLILKTDGSVYTFGDNMYGQLGIGTQSEVSGIVKVMNDAVDVNAGKDSSFAITKNNDLYRWGIGKDYSSAESNTECVTLPKLYAENVLQVNPHNHINFILKTDGTVWVYDIPESNNEYIMSIFDYLPFKIADDVSVINDGDCGYEHNTLLLKSDGSVHEFKIDQKNEEDRPYFSVTKVMNDIIIPDREYDISIIEFMDIKEERDEVQNAIRSLTKAGIINGITETEFMPDKEITRTETAALLLRMTGKGDETGEASFSDVSANDWYYGIAGASQKYGIINGYEDNTFRGNETVSELQLVSLAARTLRNEGTAVEPEEAKTLGAGIVPDWAYEDIEYALNHEIITEAEASNISDKPMTRGEAAVILYRLYNVV